MSPPGAEVVRLAGVDLAPDAAALIVRGMIQVRKDKQKCLKRVEVNWKKKGKLFVLYTVKSKIRNTLCATLSQNGKCSKNSNTLCVTLSQNGKCSKNSNTLCATLSRNGINYK
jgi:hypothetical protein